MSIWQTQHCLRPQSANGEQMLRKNNRVQKIRRQAHDGDCENGKGNKMCHSYARDGRGKRDRTIDHDLSSADYLDK